MSRDHAYLRSRGFTDATITDLKWSVGNLLSGARKYGLPPGIPVWRIPYLAGQHRRVLFERVRLVDATDIERHGGRKYRQPARTQLRPYDPDGHLERGELDQLLIIEGEANAASVRQTLPELPVIGLPGKVGLKAHRLQGKLAPNAVVWLWLDLHEQGSEAAQTRLADLIASANVSDLRLVGQTAGLDANDMLRGFRTDAAQHIRRTLDEATPAVKPRRFSLPPRPWNTQSAPELQVDPALSPRRQVPENSLVVPEASSVLPVYSAEAEAQLERENELGYDEEAVRAAAALLGMRLDEPAACVLPGHRGSAVIRRDPGLQQFRYLESGCGDRAEGRSLADVRAAIAYGRVVGLSGIESWCWYSRLFSEANRDLIAPAHAELPPLPNWATDELRLLADGFLLHLQLRWREPEYQGQPVAFARSFAAAWSSLVRPDDPQNMLTYRLLGKLEQLDIIRRDEPAGRAFTFLPGEGQRRSRQRRGGRS